ncbi:Uncharacterised protein [Mycobacteroides abscessus subsp. abscessus]|nr:Uncharacterised protein [Mycobacteroides abscessus subsp. abscessus]
MSMTCWAMLGAATSLTFTKLSAPGTKHQKAASSNTIADGAPLNRAANNAKGTTATAPTKPVMAGARNRLPSRCPSIATPIASTNQISDPRGADL